MTTAAASRTEIIPLESQRAAAAALARAIRGRHTYLALTGECDVGKSIVLDAALAAVADEALRLIMVGNPRAGPLTLSGVLQQIAQYAPPPSPDAEEGDVERIHAMLQAADRKRIVIVVEDAETLKPKALTFLQFLPELAGLTAGGLQIVLVGSPGLWRLMESESLGRMREQLAVRVVVEPLADAEARYFAAWRCRERLDRFGPGATDAAVAEALVRHGLGLPARIDALVEQVELLAPSHGGVDAALVAEAADMLANGSPGPVAAIPPVIRAEPAAPDRRPRSPTPVAPASRRRRRPVLLAGLVVTAALALWLSHGRLDVPWLPRVARTGMIARKASASAVPREAPPVSVAATPPAAPPVAVATAGPNPPAPASPAPPAASAAATPPAAPPAAVATARPNPPAPASGAAPAVSAAATPPAAPPAAVATAGPNPPAPASPAPDASTAAASLAGLRKDFDAFLARAGTDTAVLTDAQKRALFAQYLAWRTGQAAAPVAADPSSAP